MTIQYDEIFRTHTDFPGMEENIAMKDSVNRLLWSYASHKITLGEMDRLANKIHLLILQTYVTEEGKNNDSET